MGIMRITNGNNFYEIENDSVTFWGLNIKTIKVELDENIINFIKENDLPFNEVVEISEEEDEDFYKLVKNNS